MKSFIFTIVILSFGLVFSCRQPDKQVPTSVIFDTDMGPDFDDVGALAVLHALADKGQANILATVTSNMYEYSVPCIEVINTYFHRADLPVGAPLKGTVYTDPRFYSKDGYWAEQIASNYPHKTARTDEAPDAVQVYRQILSAQPDTSVNIITAGYLTNMAALLQSQPDHHSKLDGMALVKKKVRRLTAMGGRFPKGKEFNISADSTSSVYVFQQWPTPILISGFEIGAKVMTGAKLVASDIVDSPVKEAYKICLDDIPAVNHESWDQTTVLAGVCGPAEYFGTIQGRMVVSPDGSDEWFDEPGGPHERLVWKIMSAEQIAQVIEELMMHQPVKPK